MNLADYLRRQFAYTEWANHEVLKTIRANGGADERSVELMAHVFSAESLWLERLKRQPQGSPVWPKADLEECERRAAEMSRRWQEYLEGITTGDLSETVSYKNSKGEPWDNTVMDILTHVITHSTYHRGQIASHMRASGQTPPYTDFIHAVRQGSVK